nr:HNH endonuclease family protein [Marinobacter pelagius]
MLNSGYRRTRFGRGWDDRDGDCRDSRAEALVASSTTRVRFASNRECRVVTGRWISPFTGNVIQNSSDIDIDHVVPLAWSWAHGADDWSDEKRERFANDPVNLWPVEAGLNRSKGAKGPDQWLPPSGQCQYVARFSRVVKQYDLQLTTRERGWLKNFLEECR